MFKTSAEAAALARELRAQVGGVAAQVAIAPPFTALPAAHNALVGSSVELFAQNCHWEASGAYTGEVSAPMLRELGCAGVILGHSERRQLFGETDATVQKKLKAALGAGLTAIVCVGETLAEREAQRETAVVSTQVRGALAGGLTSADTARIAFAYEPVWAIGTGKVATPAQAQAMHATIRGLLRERVGGAADGIRILYGGSVKPDNAATLLSQPDIDGALVGGASLQAADFSRIVAAARERV